MERDQQQFLDELKAKTQFPKVILERTDFWEELLTKLPKKLWQFFLERDGAAKFIAELMDVFHQKLLCRNLIRGVLGN